LEKALGSDHSNVAGARLEILVANLGDNRPHLLRAPHLKVECFVQLDQQMLKFPVLRAFSKIRLIALVARNKPGKYFDDCPEFLQRMPGSQVTPSTPLLLRTGIISDMFTSLRIEDRGAPFSGVL
jgi:hypothetical protein